MNTWHSPWAFLLLPVLLVAFYFIWRRVNQKRASLQFSNSMGLAQFKPSTLSLDRARWVKVPMYLKFASLIFAVVALARPQDANERVRKNIDGIDIMITLDISDSMMIEDMPPFENRLESAKNTIKDFVRGRNSDRIGLVLFMGESFTKIPPTLDYDLVVEELQFIQPSRNIKMGTAIGVSLANAVARLKDSKAKSKVIVFLTDGENNSGNIDPLTGLDIAKGYGIKIYSIGIGKDGPTKLPIISMDAFGNKVKRYQPFESTINEELLKKMADETGGRYYRATSGTKLEQIFTDIDRLEKTKVELHKYTQYTEKFVNWLWLAFFLYLLATTLEWTILRRAP